MPEKITAEDLLNNIVGTIAESSSKQKSVSFFGDDKSDSVGSQLNRLFGRQKTCSPPSGWRKMNKKISASVLTGATFVWVLFEWLNYHFLTLVGFALVLGMLAQFLWSNFSGLVNRSSSKIPRLVLPEDLFVNIAISIGAEINRGLEFIQDVACGGNLKQFLVVVASLWAASVIGSWCNFLTVLYIGFIAAHTLPVLYEKYDDQIDSFVYSVFGQLQNHYRKLDTSVLSRIPKGNLKAKKHD